jgi:hypothetical protein
MRSMLAEPRNRASVYNWASVIMLTTTCVLVLRVYGESEEMSLEFSGARVSRASTAIVYNNLPITYQFLQKSGFVSLQIFLRSSVFASVCP